MVKFCTSHWRPNENHFCHGVSFCDLFLLQRVKKLAASKEGKRALLFLNYPGTIRASSSFLKPRRILKPMNCNQLPDFLSLLMNPLARVMRHDGTLQAENNFKKFALNCIATSENFMLLKKDFCFQLNETISWGSEPKLFFSLRPKIFWNKNPHHFWSWQTSRMFLQHHQLYKLTEIKFVKKRFVNFSNSDLATRLEICLKNESSQKRDKCMDRLCRWIQCNHLWHQLDFHHHLTCTPLQDSTPLSPRPQQLSPCRIEHSSTDRVRKNVFLTIFFCSSPSKKNLQNVETMWLTQKHSGIFCWTSWNVTNCKVRRSLGQRMKNPDMFLSNGIPQDFRLKLTSKADILRKEISFPFAAETSAQNIKSAIPPYSFAESSFFLHIWAKMITKWSPLSVSDRKSPLFGVHRAPMRPECCWNSYWPASVLWSPRVLWTWDEPNPLSWTRLSVCSVWALST